MIIQVNFMGDITKVANVATVAAALTAAGITGQVAVRRDDASVSLDTPLNDGDYLDVAPISAKVG